jgi:PAS domain S-box-containing protein
MVSLPSSESMPQHLDDLTQQDLRVLLDHAPDAIGRFDRELRHVYVNEATARANHRPVVDFAGRTMQQLGHATETCNIINSNLRAVFGTGRERNVQLEFHSPSGSMWFQCRMVPEFDAAHKVEYVLCISRDITQQKLAESALQEAQRRAAAAEVTAELAHEINNPLSAVVNAVYLLSRNISLDPEARNLLDMAATNLDRIANISHRMLSIYDRK